MRMQDTYDDATSVDESYLKGEESEERVFKEVWDMLVWNELPPLHPGLYPRRSFRWSNYDMNGVDIIIPTDCGDIFIQVKSSCISVSKFFEDERNKEIIGINGQLLPIQIIRRLRRDLESAYRRLSSQQ